MESSKYTADTKKLSGNFQSYWTNIQHIFVLKNGSIEGIPVLLENKIICWFN